jgi:hypothetical protein
MVALTAWLLVGVGQVAALADGAPVVMIMPTETPRVASAPVRARRRRVRGGVTDAMSRFLLWGCGVLPREFVYLNVVRLAERQASRA